MKKALAQGTAIQTPIIQTPTMQPDQTNTRMRRQIVGGFALAGLLAGLGLFASRPAHTAGGPIPVSVANTPLATTDTTVAGRTPFSTRMDLTFVNGSASGTVTVPAGKRLVLTYVSADAGVKVGAHVLLDLATVSGGAEVEAHSPQFPRE